MAEGILFGIAEEVLMNLASTALEEIALAWGFKDRLEKLKTTINTIKGVLLDAEERQANNQPDSHAVRSWLERLSTAVYAADDLFDEVATIASRKQLMDGNKFTKKVRTFFSSSNQAAVAFSISRKIKTVRERLDDIVKDSTEFAFVYINHDEGRVISTMKGRDQTYSYVHQDHVVGREDDIKAILQLLLASNKTDNERLEVVSIVGIGGQGKTTLAQSMYNDPGVDEYFELRLWVCVSEDFDVKVVTEKILKSALSNIENGFEMEQLQGLLRNKLSNKRYLLVLDDVWNENREEWLKLMALLEIGSKGSKILVTTRSRQVAVIMGSESPYELKGLLEEKSLELFEKMAFKPGQSEQMPHLMEIGKEIVTKCANVPLAIRSVGSLLYGKDESKWMSIKKKSLANIFDGQNDIMEILKLSYQHLPSPLKNCFAYCALFSKDYEFDKERLIDLWMAEGFIVATNQDGQSLEELAEDYFLILLQRCFFQDIKEDKWGNIKSCKMHDLMHDLAQQISGHKCKVAKLEDSSSNREIRHLSFSYHLTSLWEIPSWMLKLKNLRTFLLPKQFSDGAPFSKLISQELVSAFRCLRVLDFNYVEIKSLPDTIGKLIHLRYLNLSETQIIELPDSITKLHNLQTLNIYNCWFFKALPKNMKELKKLRILNVDECHKLNHMPSGLGELTSLTKLPRFIVNTKHSPLIKSKLNSAKLSDLKLLDLRGGLHIKIMGELKNPLLEATEANLYDKHGLTKLQITFDGYKYDDSRINNYEDILEGLKPYSNIRNLKLYWYEGRKLPTWIMNNLCINLPNLVKVELLRCDWCQHVPSFGRLPSLKCLSLVSLRSVEYMEMDRSLDDPQPSFFPSLEKLTLMSMKNLKGWWKVGETFNNDTKEAASHQLNAEHCLSLSFFKLSKLWIEKCPNLKFLPNCPNVEELTVVNVSQSISVSKVAISSASTSTLGSGSKLKKLTVSNSEDLISLPRECLHQLLELDVQDANLVNTDDIGNEVFTSLSSSLQSLKFTHCHNLRFLAQGLEHLSAMEKLLLWNCEQLDLLQNEQVPWKSFASLRSLQMHMVFKLVSLPSGLQHLTNLRSLEITCNDELSELPEWISCFSALGYLELYQCPKVTSLPDGFRMLTGLNQLRIIECPELTERCRAPNGADWSKIQHIPFVSVREHL